MPGLRAYPAGGSTSRSAGRQPPACPAAAAPQDLARAPSAAWSGIERCVQGDVDAGQRLAHRAAFLGPLGSGREAGRVQAVDLAADGELDAGEPEPAGWVRAERDVGLYLQGLRRAAGPADLGGERHRIAGRV